MLKVRSILIIGLAFSLLLPACAPAAPTQILPASQPTLPIVTPALTLEPIGVGVPVIQYIKGQSALSVVSSLTGKPFDEFDSMPLGYYNNYAFSPDHKTLAVVSNAQLHLISLPSWEDRTVAIDLHGPLSSVT